MAWWPLPRPRDLHCIVKDALPWGTSGFWGYPTICDNQRMPSRAQEVLWELRVSGNFLTVSHGGASLGHRSCGVSLSGSETSARKTPQQPKSTQAWLRTSLALSA